MPAGLDSRSAAGKRLTGVLVVGLIALAGCSQSSKSATQHATTTSSLPAVTSTSSASTTPSSPTTTTQTTVPRPATTTTAPTTTSTTGFSALPASGFPQPVRAALSYLQTHTGLAAAGPTDLGDLGVEAAQLSATVQIGQGTGATGGSNPESYGVGLYFCPVAEPLNSPRIALECESEADTLGSFGAIEQSAATVADSEVHSLVASDGGGEVGPCPVNSKVTDLDSISVATCGTGGVVGGGEASWTDGAWTFVYELYSLSTSTLQSQIGSLLDELDQVTLPAGPGWFYQNNGDGANAQLGWAAGNLDYNVYDHASGVGAIEMATSFHLLNS